MSVTGSFGTQRVKQRWARRTPKGKAAIDALKGRVARLERKITTEQARPSPNAVKLVGLRRQIAAAKDALFAAAKTAED